MQRNTQHMLATSNAAATSITKHRRRILIVTLVSLAVTGIAAFAFAQVGAPPQLRSIVPANADFVACGHADWLWSASSSIRQVPKVSDAIAKVESQSGLSIENDFMPWMGQVAVAGMHVGQPDQRYIAYFEIRDPAKFASTEAKIASKIEGDPSVPVSFTMETYDGSQIYDLVPKKQSPKDLPVSFTLLNGWAICGVGKGATQYAIDVYSGAKPAMASDPSWSKTFAQLPADSTGWVAVDPAGMADIAATQAQVPPAVKQVLSGAALPTRIAVSFLDSGTTLDTSYVVAAPTAADRALYMQLAQNLHPVSAGILQRVPNAVLACMVNNPAFLWHWSKVSTLQAATTAAQKQAILKTFKQFSAVDAYLQHFNGDAGLAITWRADRGFGLVALAQADTHLAAVTAAKAIVTSLRATGAPIQGSGNVWTLNMPGLDMMIPQTVPLKLAPYLSAKSDWLILGSHPMWTPTPPSNPTLKIPAEATQSPQVMALSMQWLPSVLSLIEQQPSLDSNATQGIALVRGLNLGSSVWTSWEKIDPNGQWVTGSARVSNWDWRTALANTVQALQNWKPDDKSSVDQSAEGVRGQNAPRIGDTKRISS